MYKKVKFHRERIVFADLQTVTINVYQLVGHLCRIKNKPARPVFADL